MKVHTPSHIYREDVLRWAWWMHTILVIIGGTSLIGLGKMVKNGTVERGEVGTRRNDVALLKIREPLLQKIGFYFITNAHARAGAVGVSRRGQQQDANANPQIRSTSIHHQQSNSYV